jgi:SAM-dependent methyltransferase
VVEAKDRAFYDEDYFAGRTRSSLPHTREVVAPLSQRTARFLCRRCRPARVLDIGCAMGFLVDALSAEGAPEAYGVDISLYAVAQATPAQRRHLMVADAEAGLPIRSGSCDLVTAVDVFEHLADPRPALREIGRVLCDQGQAFLKICHPRHPNAHRDPSHVNVRPLGYWRRTFRHAGFSATRLYEAEFAPEHGLGGRLKVHLRRWREWAVIGTPADYKFLLRKRRHG